MRAIRNSILGSAAAIALLAMPVAFDGPVLTDLGLTAKAFAQGHGQGAGGKGEGGRPDTAGGQGKGSAQAGSGVPGGRSGDAVTTGGAGSGKGGANAGSGIVGGRGQGGAASVKGGKPATAAAEEDSDRPAWAGVKGGKAGGGGKPAGKGGSVSTLYADLYLVVRDANGVPVLVDGYPQVLAFITNPDGSVSPLIVDGQQILIPRNSEGELATTVTVGSVTYNVVPAEVELGRTNVARSPSRVLQKALDSVLALVNAPGAVLTVDASGRLTINGDVIDSPLENLALYVELLNPSKLTGSITATLPANFSPAAALAAAADKTGIVNVDYVVYLNTILGINTVVNGQVTSYYDYSSFNYDRYTTWKDVTATVLVLKDGVYVPTVVNVYETVFASTNWTDPTATGGMDDFATAANDCLQVVEYLHDNTAP